VFSWWNENHFRFPNIFHFVKKYLIVLATSVPSERVFSEAGEIISAQRTRLSRKRANHLIFLYVIKKNPVINN
jgi:zinc finger BED domain-containing protein 1 (E3 SUMO-protein ligase ZBED1)